jgi:hypothetical protein
LLVESFALDVRTAYIRSVVLKKPNKMRQLLIPILVCIFSQTAEAQVTAEITHPSCLSCDDGAIDIQVYGCVAPYTYEWVGPGGFITFDEDLEFLVAGVYTFNATESNGFSSSLQAILIPGASPSQVDSPFVCPPVLGPWCGTEYTCPDSVTGPGEACAFPPSCWTNPVIYEWTNDSGDIISDQQCVTGLMDEVYYLTIEGDLGEIFQFTLDLTDDCEDGLLYQVACSLASSTDELSMNFSLYPNPSNGHFSIDLDGISDEYFITIYDLSGQQVYSRSALQDRAIIDVRFLNKGLYLLSVTDISGQLIKSEKLLVE